MFIKGKMLVSVTSTTVSLTQKKACVSFIPNKVALFMLKISRGFMYSTCFHMKFSKLCLKYIHRLPSQAIPWSFLHHTTYATQVGSVLKAGAWSPFSVLNSGLGCVIQEYSENTDLEITSLSNKETIISTHGDISVMLLLIIILTFWAPCPNSQDMSLSFWDPYITEYPEILYINLSDQTRHLLTNLTKRWDLLNLSAALVSCHQILKLLVENLVLRSSYVLGTSLVLWFPIILVLINLGYSLILALFKHLDFTDPVQQNCTNLYRIEPIQKSVFIISSMDLS